ncbi:MAG: hypothetical protein R3E45_06970 [Rhodocyclaceae bacterium]
MMPSSLLQDFPRLPQRFDEMRLDEGGDVRPQWAPFVDRLELLPADTLQRRARYVRESIEADGVTYTVSPRPPRA